MGNIMNEREHDAMKRDFQKQLERLRAKEAIIGRSTFNEALWKQRNPSMKDKNIKGLFYGVVRARQTREKDLQDL
jgi:hypothetical protein